MGENSVHINEDFNSLSNDDLKRRLEEEFHFECGPITSSTRRVYEKKLLKLINEKYEEMNGTNHQNNGNTDNESNASNEEHNTASKSSAMRLSTLRTPSQRNSPIRRKLDEEFGSTSAKTSTPKTSTKTSRRQSSQPMSAMKKTTATPKSVRKSVAVINSQTMSSLTNYSSESSENDDMNDEELSKTRKSPRKKSSPAVRVLPEQLKSSQRVPFARPYPPPPLMSTTNASKLTAFSALTRPPLRRVGLVSSQPTAKLANYSDSEAETEQEQNSSIRERLLRHRPGLNISSITSTSKPSQSTTAVGFEDSNNFSSTSNFISFAILVLVVLFFVFIFSFYFYSRISSSPKTTLDLTNFHFIDEELVAPLCPNGIAHENQLFGDSEQCLKYKSDIMPALTIVKEIKTFIEKTQLTYYCGSYDKKSSIIDPKSFHIKDLKNAIEKKIEIIKTNREGVIASEGDKLVYNRDFMNALTLIQLNPNWQLHCELDSLREISKIVIKDDYPLNLPFGCYVLLVLKINSWKIFLAFITIFIGFSSILYLKHTKKVRTEEQDLVYDLVEKSLELLQSPDNPQSMPVLHIRDTLLSPAERKSAKYIRIWNKAVKHIESTESRVKVEVEIIDGEDFKAWKWIGVNAGLCDAQGNTSPIIRTGGIEWQGQAFTADNVNPQTQANNGGLPPNTAFEAPTVFLKIRNMFDKETQLSEPSKWKSSIRSAILQKTAALKTEKNKHGIVHMEIEDNSEEGLVYLKCDSTKSATDAYNALHGWWCEKKLVSVRFLKAERYYHRFPEAISYTTPLTS